MSIFLFCLCFIVAHTTFITHRGLGLELSLVVHFPVDELVTAGQVLHSFYIDTIYKTIRLQKKLITYRYTGQPFIFPLLRGSLSVLGLV